jgi:hypothetical protein
VHRTADISVDRSAPARARLRVRTGVGGLGVQVVLVALFALAYFGIRGLTRGGAERAFGNADRLVEVERALGVAWETGIQGAIAGWPRVVTLANWIYIYGHWPVIVTAMVVLYLRAPARYRLLRDAVIVSGVIGMVVFATVPVAPPRFGTLPVMDTVSDRSHGYRALQPPELTNPYAALPSLHFGWNLLVGMVLWWSTRRTVVRAFAVVMPCAMGWAVVATGNHYVLDVVAGGAVALVGMTVALRLTRAPAPGRLAA